MPATAIQLFRPKAGNSPALSVVSLPEPEEPEAKQKIRDLRKLHCKTDVAYFIATFVFIHDPVFGKILFNLWGFQRDMLKKFVGNRLHVILKARQLGMTWLVAAYLLWVVLFYPSKVCLILSIGERDAKKVLRRVKFMWRHLPEWLIDHVELVDNNATMFVLRHPDGTESKIESMPATEDSGRSEAASIVVLDEWAIQRWQDEIFTAIKPTVSAGGQFIGLSTAKGFGNLFHMTWNGAVNNDNGYVASFLGWDSRPDRDVEWYKRETMGMTPLGIAQEYPSSPDEAFVQTGNVVFTSGLLPSADNVILLPRGNIPAEYRLGGFTVWQLPQPKKRYILAADCAEGIVGEDWDAAIVLDVDSGQQVAELHGYWPPNIYAQKLAAVGRFYNTALIAPERNNHGHSVINTLANQIGYAKIYRHRDYDVETRRTVDKQGWPTNKKTKPIMIADLEEAIRMGWFRFASLKLLSELRVYSYLNNGTMGAQAGYNDDLVIAAAIAWQVRKHRPAAITAQQPAA